MNSLVFALEIIGTIAFAISGAIVAMKKEMDLFGVMILGGTTAVGGGIIRDIILGLHPPTAFVNYIYAAVAIATSLISFGVAMVKPLRGHHLDRFLILMDSLGLGVFTVVGIQTAYALIPESSGFLLVFLGVLTGVGGGVLRDIMAGTVPYIFVKHFYATASLLGALLCVFLLRLGHESAAWIAGVAVILLLRICAAKFCWELPKCKNLS